MNGPTVRGFSCTGAVELTLQLGFWTRRWLHLTHLYLDAAMARQPLLWGFVFMILATALWALAFAAPLAMLEASSIEIALGRFIAYGLLSLGLMGVGRIVCLPRRVLLRATIYALLGNIIYYFLLVLGIRFADATLAVLIIGMLPVTVALASQIGVGPGAFRPLALPLALFGLGAFFVSATKVELSAGPSSFTGFGVACIVASLVIWTWYAVDNAAFLKRQSHVTPTEWSSVVGVMSLGIALIGLAAAWGLGIARNPLTLDKQAFVGIATWSLVLGLGATWFGTVLFNLASKLLPTTLMGQLIIFEAFFGMAYVFAFTGERPQLLELLGGAIALMAIWMSVRTMQRLDRADDP